jgi:hypothetical protein
MSYFDPTIEKEIPGISNWNIPYHIEDQLRLRTELIYYYVENRPWITPKWAELNKILNNKETASRKHDDVGTQGGHTLFHMLTKKDLLRYAGIDKWGKPLPIVIRDHPYPRQGEKNEKDTILEEKHWIDENWLLLVANKFNRSVMVLTNDYRKPNDEYLLTKWIIPEVLTMWDDEESRKKKYLKAANELNQNGSHPIILLFEPPNHYNRFMYQFSVNASHARIGPEDMLDRQHIAYRTWSDKNQPATTYKKEEQEERKLKSQLEKEEEGSECRDAHSSIAKRATRSASTRNNSNK